MTWLNKRTTGRHATLLSYNFDNESAPHATVGPMDDQRDTRLTDAELTAALAELPGWKASGPGKVRIRKVYQFRSFDAAFAWMTRAAVAIRELDHHPSWTNMYSRVEVELFTLACGGVTAHDVALAKALDATPT